MIALRSRFWFLLGCVPLCAIGGCGSDAGSGAFSGSAAKDYDLVFDQVVISRQETRDGKLDAMTVEYRRGGPDERQIPVKVIANAPIEAGQTRDISGSGGGITRAMNDHSVFRELTAGTIVFDTLDAGAAVDGKFFVTFDNGRTLNGEFAGTIELLKL